jgi:hypothetical protein
MAKNTSRRFLTIVSIPASIMGLVAVVMLIQNPSIHAYLETDQANSQSHPSSDCMQKIITDEQKKAPLSLHQKAVSLAVNSDEFKSKTQGYNIVWNKLYDEWNFDTNSCSVTLKNIVVIYSLFDSKGFAKNITVEVDPTSNTILNATE